MSNPTKSFMKSLYRLCLLFNAIKNLLKMIRKVNKCMYTISFQNCTHLELKRAEMQCNDRLSLKNGFGLK